MQRRDDPAPEAGTVSKNDQGLQLLSHDQASSVHKKCGCDCSSPGTHTNHGTEVLERTRPYRHPPYPAEIEESATLADAFPQEAFYSPVRHSVLNAWTNQQDRVIG